MAAVSIPIGELGTTRVFSLSMSAAEAQQLRDDVAVQTSRLGSVPQNPHGIEVFPLTDLGEMGLAGFLRDGVDARAEDIERDRIKLAALEGWVLLLHSTSYAQKGAQLTPDPALTLIGTYAQTPANTTAAKLEAEAANPYTGAVPAGPPEVSRSRTRGGWIVLALVLLALPFLLWAFA